MPVVSSAPVGGFLPSYPGQVTITDLTVAGGQFSTDSVSQISLANATIANATINGKIELNSGSLLADDTLVGTVVRNGSIILSGNITNNANWTQLQLFASATINLASSTTLVGQGTITITSTTFQSSLGTPTLTIGSNQILQGSGNIPSTILLFNTGIINATTIPTGLSTINLTINYAAGIYLNTGILESTSNGTLILSGIGNVTLLDNSNGTILATGLAPNTGGVSISGMTVSGGLLSTDATGVIRLTGSTLANASTSEMSTSPINDAFHRHPRGRRSSGRPCHPLRNHCQQRQLDSNRRSGFSNPPLSQCNPRR